MTQKQKHMQNNHKACMDLPKRVPLCRDLQAGLMQRNSERR